MCDTKIIQIAKYFINKAASEGEFLSNLKLQKLVYYAQGLHLALYHEALFTAKIKAWTYGPVSPQLYHTYKQYGGGGIPEEKDFDMSAIKNDTQVFLDDVYDIFGQFSAVRLMELSHTDQCWIDAEIDEEITHSAMEKCLEKYVKKET